MTLRRSAALAFTVAIATIAGVVTWHLLGQWKEGPGPKLRRDCVSLVDSVLAEDQSVSRLDLEIELGKRGVKVPSLPPSTSGTSNRKEDLEKWLKGSGEYGQYAAAMKVYDATWEEIRRSPEYQPAWKAAFEKKREEAIKECIVNRARREGVNVR